MTKAILKYVNEVGNDSVDIGITYILDTGKEYTKSHNLQASNYQTLQSVIDLANVEIQQINTFSSIVEILKPYIGLELK